MNLEPPRPLEGRCTGCNLKFDDEDDLCEDACEECGYQVCDSCSVDTSNGAFVHDSFSMQHTNIAKVPATAPTKISGISIARCPRDGTTQTAEELAIRVTGTLNQEMSILKKRLRRHLENATIAGKQCIS